jgi:hypothetical protein
MIRDYKLNKNSRISGLDRIRAIDQNRKVWEYLKRYQSSSFVQKKLKKEIKVNRNLIKTKSDQISSLMVQCESYYQASTHSTLEIKPLILYYGMVGLSKCLILSGDNTYTLSALAPSNSDHSTHGLTVAPLAGSAADAAIRDGNNIDCEFCYVRTTPNKVGLYNLLRQCYSNTIIPNNTRFSVKDLLSFVPELYKEYQSYFQSKPNVWHCDSHFGVKSLTDSIQLIMFRDWDFVIQRNKPNEKYRATITKCFPELLSLYTLQPNSDDKYMLNNDATSIDDCIYVSQLQTLDTYAFRKYQRFCLSDFDIHFILMYVLSNLVRYRQDKWSRLIRRVDNDEIFLIESFIEISQFKYPYLILRELDNADYVFTGQVATWG